MPEQELRDGLMIGPAMPEEMDAVCEIAEIAWEPIHEAMIESVGTDIHDAISADWKEKKAEQIRGQFRRNADHVLAIREGETVVAFVTFGCDASKSLGTIHNNAVDPKFQGRGIATAMYSHVLDLFRKAGLKYASVGTGLDPGHLPARRAYEKAGFNLKQEDVTYYRRLSESQE